MKNMIIAAGLTTVAIAVGAKDPVIMTVNGVDIPKSEFEYLYHKNSRQQADPQPISDYAEMFKLYKLKVADAIACGIDTTSSFRKEMRQYRHELAEPYLADSAFMEALVDVACSRIGEDVEAYHIMVLKDPSPAKDMENRNLLDSLRRLILSGADFGELAGKYSVDKSSNANNGYLGFISQGKFPYDFETAVYTTPEGAVSDVVESQMGYHLVKSGARRPAKGKVKVSHIMKLVKRDASPDEVEKVHSEIDSIYNIVVADPSLFSSVAKQFSDDRGSARQGGDLPAFAAGEMVPEFEEAAYALRPGEISSPVRSMYGWHIIKKREDLPLPTCEQLRSDVMRAIANPRDDRYHHVMENRDRRLMSKHNAKKCSDVLEDICACVSDEGLETMISKYSESPLAKTVIAEIDGVGIPVSEFMEYLSGIKVSDGSFYNVRKSYDSFLSARLLAAEEDWLYDNESDYRNLLNEYHDGTLLYEVSLAKVWDKAAKDSVGLENYYLNHKDEYKWETPKAKGFLIQASNDSVASQIRKRLANVPDSEVSSIVRKEFAGDAKIERVLVSEGVNPMVDNILFGAPAVKPQIAKFTTYFLHSGRVLDSPEELNDVKGQVVTDYQMQLESEWEEWLKRTYPVKINKKEIKKVK